MKELLVKAMVEAYQASVSYACLMNTVNSREIVAQIGSALGRLGICTVPYDELSDIKLAETVGDSLTEAYKASVAYACIYPSADSREIVADLGNAMGRLGICTIPYDEFPEYEVAAE